MVAVPVQGGSWFVGGTAGLSISDQRFVDHEVRGIPGEYNFYELGRAPVFGAQLLYEPRKLLYVLADVSAGPAYDMTVISCNFLPSRRDCLGVEERTRTIRHADLGAGLSWTGGAVNLQAGGGLGAAFFREVLHPGDEAHELDVRQALNARAAVSVVTGRLRLGAEGRFVRVGNPPRLSPEPLHLWQARLAVMVRVSD